MSIRSVLVRVLIGLAGLLVLAIGALLVFGLMLPPFGVAPIEGFAAVRATHRTQLVRRGPSPQGYTVFASPPGVREVTYPSGSLSLKGWLAAPGVEALKTERGFPVMVYLHGGFAADQTDLLAVDAFRERGFAVFMPAYRGENGNPGHHEFAYGELDDVRAAITWVAQQPELDPQRVVVFGHSAGGMLAALLSLLDTPRVLDTGSTGGLYAAEFFDQFELPFRDSEQERALRLFAPHVDQMKQAHLACVGAEDAYAAQILADLRRELGGQATPLAWLVVPGDHGSAVAPCVSAYLERVLRLLKVA